jgi:hypothetical protein
MRPLSVLGLSLALAALASAQAPQPQSGTPAAGIPYPVSLYRMTDVGKALNLTADQVNRLNAVTDRVQTQYRDNYSKLTTIAEADRAARLRELNQQYVGDWNKAARDIFDETQRTRYQQLNYQYGGFDTLYYPDVQTRLRLTEAQIKDLGAQWDWSTQQWQAMERLAATDATKAAQMHRDYWTQRQERFNKFLTPEQQRAWATMTGDAYTFQPPFAPRR